MEFKQFVNHDVEILGRRLHSPSLVDVAWLEDAHVFFSREPRLGVPNFWYFNVVIHKLCKIQFWKMLFANGFSYKHCNFSPLCLPVKTASKTVIRPIQD